jgi:Uncharacterised protein family UPF0047
MKTKRIDVITRAREEILLVTGDVNAALASLTSGDGICTIVAPHTTCAISVNENADPDVLTDLTRALRAMIPDVRFDHSEGTPTRISSPHSSALPSPGPTAPAVSSSAHGRASTLSSSTDRAAGTSTSTSHKRLSHATHTQWSGGRPRPPTARRRAGRRPHAG